MYFEEKPLAVITCGDCRERIGIYPDVYNDNRIVCPNCGAIWSLKGSLKEKYEEPYLKYRGDLRQRHYTDSIYYIDNYNKTLSKWIKSSSDIVRYCIFLGLFLAFAVMFLYFGMIGTAIGAAVVALVTLLIALLGLSNRCPNCGKMYGMKKIHSHHIIGQERSGQTVEAGIGQQDDAIERVGHVAGDNTSRYVVRECERCKYRMMDQRSMDNSSAVPQ